MSDRRRIRRDPGFTLVELIVVVVLMGLIATVITAATTIIIRTEEPTNARVNETRTLHGLNTWLGRDTSETPPGGFDLFSASGTDCTTPAPGINLVHMHWTENTGSPIDYATSYRFVDQGTDYGIERHTCSGTGLGPWANGTVVKLSGDLSSTPPNVTPILDGASQVIGVTIEVFTNDGQSVLVDGTSRNPGATLPPTTTTSTTTTSTTTTTTTTTTTP